MPSSIQKNKKSIFKKPSRRLTQKKFPSAQALTTLIAKLKKANNQLLEQEKILRQNDTNIKALLENTLQSFILIDRKFNVVEFNKTAFSSKKKVAGKKLQKGIHISEYVPPKLLPEFAKILAKCFKGNPIVVTRAFVGVDGTPFTFIFSFTPVNYDGKKYNNISISSLDITELKETEDKLRESEAYLKALMRSSDIGLWAIDKNYKILFFNEYHAKSLKDFFGIKIKIGADARELIHPGSDKDLTLFMYDKALNGQSFSYEEKLTLKNGTSIWTEFRYAPVKINDEVIGVVVRAIGITSRKEMEEKIIESEANLSSIIENSKESIWSVDTNYKLLKFNSHFKNLLKYLINRDIQISDCILYPEFGDDVIKQWVERYDKCFNGESVIFEHERDKKFFKIFMHPLIENGGRITGAVCVYRDVTKKKKDEQIREKLTNDLITRNKELQEFAYIISHNLRAPVVNLEALVSLYDKQNPDADDNHEILDNFEYCIKQLKETLEDLIQVVSINSDKTFKREKIQFEKLLNDIKSSLYTQLKEANADVRIDFESAPAINYPYSHLHNIVINLITNSIKFRSPFRPLKISVSTEKVNGYINLKYSDNGIGFNYEKYKDRVFGLYQRFHEGKEGKGLGLYLINSILREMDGKLNIWSKENEGTRFDIFLKE
ncbi:MAG TPA: PAS domain S-box protein [Ignavibacteria bacterium]|nr:PAS domain S-box protein [Ignavibacteria bacterium]